MADNTAINTGSGDTVRDKDRSGVKTQIFGIDTAINDATERLMGAGNPLPVNTNPSRTLMTIATAVAGVTAGTTATETIMTCANFYRALSSVGSNTTFAITNGKTLRITSISVTIKNNAAAVALATFTLRAAVAGSTTASSPPVVSIPLALVATTGLSNTYTATFPDGIDIAGAASGTANSVGISCNPVFASTAPTIWASITGYEYTT